KARPRLVTNSPATPSTQTYGSDNTTTQKTVPNNNATDSERFCSLSNTRCNQRPVAAWIATRPKRYATISSSSAFAPTNTLTTGGSTSDTAGTPKPITTAPKRPMMATRRLVKRSRVAARLIAPGVAAVKASEMMNQKSTASTRRPKAASVQCGVKSDVGL